jgi:hypothetical protein
LEWEMEVVITRRLYKMLVLSKGEEHATTDGHR